MAAFCYSAFLHNLCIMLKKIIIPNSDNFGASSSEVAVAAPPWLTSESEDDEPVTHKLEVHAGIMAIKHVWGELASHKRSLTHRPSSQGWASRCP